MENEIKRLRYENPSGWLKLTRYEGVRLLIDALIDSDPEREFNKSELARKAGVSNDTVYEHEDLLLEIDVLEEVGSADGEETRYKFNAEGGVGQSILNLNSAVNAAAQGIEPNKAVETDRDKMGEFTTNRLSVRNNE